jgi:hypothetical protein
MAKRRYDWDAIRQQYVTGGPEVTLESLAAEHGCYPGTIRKHAATGKWAEAREQFRDRVRTKANKKIEDQAVNIEAKRRADMLKIGDGLVSLGFKGLKRIDQDLEDHPEERLPLDQSRLLVKDGVEIARHALGMPDLVAMSKDEVDERILRKLEEIDALEAESVSGEVN